MTSAPSKDGQAAALGPQVRSIDGREVVFDQEGFLSDPDAWTESLALILAVEAGLTGLDDAQWRVIRFFARILLY